MDVKGILNTSMEKILGSTVDPKKVLHDAIEVSYTYDDSTGEISIEDICINSMYGGGMEISIMELVACRIDDVEDLILVDDNQIAMIQDRLRKWDERVNA
jgi:hypothetical protein